MLFRSHDPEVLILDEPTDGLDPNQKHEVRGLIRAMAPEKAIIISTHILEEVDAVCSRAVIIAGGRLVADGTPAEFEARSRHHNAVTIALPVGQAQAAFEAFKAASGVAAVEQSEIGSTHARLTVIPADGQDIAASLRALIAAKPWQIAEFHVERGRMDEVFRSITTRPKAEAAHA